jgi:hypothetical protein
VIITAAAASSSGPMPRVLELVQFLAIYCTSLSSQQQIRVSEFQIASLTHMGLSKAEYCGVCPGTCIQPLVLVMPMFALTTSLFVLCLVVTLDFCSARRSDQPAKSLHAPQAARFGIRNHLLQSTKSPADGQSSRRHAIITFCTRFFRGLIETCSSYILMPSTFVFVLNVRPSSFAQASFADRAMIVLLPFVTVLFRALVIFRRVVRMTSADQKQLAVGSVCSCLIAAVLSQHFNQVKDANQLLQSFPSQTQPQYIILALFCLQIITQTVIRLRAVEESFFDFSDWPWSSSSGSPFAVQSLATHRLFGSMERALTAACVAVAKFFVLNYVALSQLAMVVTGLASAPATSSSIAETSAIFIGSIPLMCSGVMLLHSVLKFIVFLWLKWFKRGKSTPSFRGKSDILL